MAPVVMIDGGVSFDGMRLARGPLGASAGEITRRFRALL
jgi:hypothetical protein